MVLVRLNEGLLEGHEVQNEYGGTYYSFKGIPYAAPPVGELRFKPPQPVQSWTGVRSAKKYGDKCYQFDGLYPNQENLSEDCLYLNVFTPDINPNQPLSVMVFIHGGEFLNGSGDDDYYGPEFLVRHGVILVTLNYRLGPLGFLCLHTAAIPGNAGMKDQVAAMIWIKKNIHSFGGDPDNITIFGESAGSASVSCHLISPMSRGLFQKAITQSGAVTCWWAEDFQSRDKALLLAKQLGCLSENDKELEDFFKKQPGTAYINIKLHLLKAQKPYELPFGIANEKDFGQERFFYGDVVHALQNNIHEGIKIMTGYTKDEGLMALAFGCSLEKMINEAKYFNEFLVPRWIRTQCAVGDQLEVGRRLRQFYFKGGEVTKEGFLRFLSMDLLTYDIILAAKFYSNKNKVYFYKFTCISDRNVYASAFNIAQCLPNKSVVCHGDDLAYIFPMKLLCNKVNQESESFKLIEMTTKLWTNFAKYGNPTPDKSLGVNWKPYTMQTQEYLDLGNQPVMNAVPQKEEVEFWDSIFKEYLPEHSI